MMQTCDVLIVGGGPAGSSLAWGLRNSGLKIMLMDKQSFPRNKTCAGWITPAVIETLQLDVEQYSLEHTFQPVHGFRIGQIGSDVIDIHYSGTPVSYGIRRCEFDHYLLQRCKSKLLLGESIKSIVRENNYWIINDYIKTGLLVGAGGHFCPVARYLGARVGGTETAVAAQEIEFRLTPQQQKQCMIDPEVPELYFCTDLKGYGWILRKGDYLNVGLGREDQHKLSEHVDHFCRFLYSQNKISFELPEKFNGHAYLLYQHSTRPELTDGVLLIGDAAGLAFTQSGEGIRPAIESGLIASDVLQKANGNYSADNLEIYSREIKKRFGKRGHGADHFPHVLNKLKQKTGRQLLKSGWFVRNIVINQWFLHSDQAILHIA